MSTGLLFQNARDLFEAFPTARDDIRARPGPADKPLEFWASLVRSPTPEEAITYGAYLLPRRQAVWWGHECLRNLNHLLSDDDRHMMALAETWVREPEEHNRVAAMQDGMAAKDKTPGVWIALAAGWSGGSMAGPDVPPVRPPPNLTPKAVNAAILSILAKVDNKHRATTLRGFVDMGIKDIASK